MFWLAVLIGPAAIAQAPQALYTPPARAAVGSGAYTPPATSSAAFPQSPIPPGAYPPLSLQPDEETLFASPTRKDRIGRIVAPVMINGQGPFRLIVDTGASYSTVSPQLVQTLGLQASDEASFVVDGITGSARVPSVAISHLQAGDLQYHSIRLPVIWAPVLGGADGILGAAA